MPTGKISGIKKTYLLRSSAIICTISALLFIFLSFYFHKTQNEWFYLFCMFCGLHQVVKGALYNTDSSSYFGSTLTIIGILLLTGIYYNIPNKECLFLFAFAISSLYVFIKYSEGVHALFAGAYCYEGIILYLFLLKKINLTKFLIFNSFLLFIFLLICAIILIKIVKRRRSYV